MSTLTNTFSSPKMMYCGLGFVLTLISGVVLSNFGRPLNSAIFGIHKIIAVATIVLLGMNIRTLYRMVDVQTLNQVLIVVTALLLLALVVSGALLSFDKLAVQAVLRIHQVMPMLALAFSVLTVYLLIGNKS